MCGLFTLVEEQINIATWKSVWRFLKIKNTTQYDPTVSLLGKYAENVITCQRDRGTSMSTATLVTVARKYNMVV